MHELPRAARSSRGFEAPPLCPGRPQGADVLRQRLPNFLDLVRIEARVENLEGHMRGVLDVDRPYVGQTPRYVAQELFRRPLLERLLSPPMIAPRFWSGTHGAVRKFQCVDVVFCRCRNVQAPAGIG